MINPYQSPNAPSETVNQNGSPDLPTTSIDDDEPGRTYFLLFLFGVLSAPFVWMETGQFALGAIAVTVSCLLLWRSV